ncbi:peptidyl-tRNA hydrolase [Truncatella angustata]|uniref:Peptidyl-tRNA hydrolase n=1 Tax=Truncatella angustata TaxID=152316 RepID=A0A9P8UHW6_9PEZI|nr:peptidyl-tRNA hydrolase [Truncatella angustata]KAH6652408.1 peptidyl-tRNA hydrolase [Truncatella angustata]KAH8202069.1 hypothetical protein TruAng_003737 [Truncatella angustata]
MSTPRFLVLSIGNPLAIYNCLHSAGHFALQSFQKLLAPNQPSWTPESHGRQPCLTSTGQPYMLIQSPTLMNASGPWVSDVWHETLEKFSLKPADLGLVVVHDELEDGLGYTRLRSWNTSHKGNNGVKSIKAHLNKQEHADAKWWRISVGIDRPPSREPEVVAEYVLRQISKEQKDVIEEQAGSRILSCLQKLEQGWK